ncbi:hypothetical protein K435DRAFT_813078 [Dendrothele bispora CBS 962.96]|uniref:Uncharacterized protein n=1 Tax=Dendrothele bispora (strain CBS 962.96) TaxID=1314807 RepID=A0A4S8KMJ8_DENBC|nr:hypothetical protein K435DRAFT_813078 [Dendrothele bispora CBS 962.96]
MKYYVPRFGVYRKDIGACTSAHNIAADCCLNGVGLYTEDTPPTDVADRMSASFPNNFMGNGISQRQTEAIAERGRTYPTPKPFPIITRRLEEKRVQNEHGYFRDNFLVVGSVKTWRVLSRNSELEAIPISTWSIQT